jgi:alpha-glucosidase (family GH31 glycosyl hydrolase)
MRLLEMPTRPKSELRCRFIIAGTLYPHTHTHTHTHTYDTIRRFPVNIGDATT